jgi:hypothetical protein
MNRSRWTTLAFTLACVLGLPQISAAAPEIIATQVVPGCNGPTPILTVTLNGTTHGFYGAHDQLYYHFDPPSPGVLGGTANPVVLMLPASFAPGSSHVVWISTSSAPTGGSASKEYPFTAPSCAPVKKGMTWKFLGTNSPSGTIRVGCGNDCNAYQGDTACTAALPILCIRKAGAGFPLPLPTTVNNGSQYSRWSGGVIGTTGAVPPPATLAGANGLCQQAFGPDWRVAEHHDGWGWGFQAYGGVGAANGRFRVHINDQPANCWQ